MEVPEAYSAYVPKRHFYRVKGGLIYAARFIAGNWWRPSHTPRKPGFIASTEVAHRTWTRLVRAWTYRTFRNPGRYSNPCRSFEVGHTALSPGPMPSGQRHSPKYRLLIRNAR